MVAFIPYRASPELAEEDDALVHEDMRETPSDKSNVFLKGRVLSNNTKQSFDAGWIYQRFVNRVMHFVLSFTEEKTPWYHANVEGGNIESTVEGLPVVLGFAFMSPLFFPFVYGVAALALIPFGCFSIPYLRSFVDSADVDDNSPARRMPSKLYNSPARYSFKSIFFTACFSLWYLALSIYPWIYVYWPTSRYNCVVDVTCKDISFHMSPVLIWSTLVACAMAGFRSVKAISTSACDCACEQTMDRMKKDLKYGKALKEIIHKLSDMSDRLSFFPVFVSGESCEPDDLPISRTANIIFTGCAALHALAPLVWMMIFHDQRFLSLDVDVMTAAMLVLGVVGPFLEFRSFFVEFYDAIDEFKDVIDELLIITYIASSWKGKKSTTLKKKFIQAVSNNDKYRQVRRHELTEKLGQSYKWLCEDEKRFPGKEEAERNDLSCQDELDDLKVHQVAFNFRRVEGILLFRFVRRWMNTDILNERLEVEHFINMTVQAIVIGFLTVFSCYMHYEEITCIWAIILIDVTVMTVLVMQALTLCIAANEYLFDETQILLLTWQEQCTQWDYPDSKFELNARKPAIAWIWKGDAEEPSPVTFHGDLKEHGDLKGQTEAVAADNVYKALDSMLKRCNLLENKQKILGLEVTKELRNRIAASIASALAAVIVQTPKMLAKIPEDEKEAWKATFKMS